MIKQHNAFLRTSFLLVSLLIFLAGCNINAPINETPTPLITTLTVAVTASETATLTQPPQATETPNTVTTPIIPPTQQVIELVTAVPQIADVPTEIPPTATETPGPYVYVINEGDTLGFIIQLQPWAYTDPAVFNAIVALNDSMVSADILPPPGTELLIPRRTPTPIPQGIELTLTSDAGLNVERFGSVVLPMGAEPGCHNVSEGETLVGIADIYGTTLEVVSQLNQNLNWTGCNFTEYSGGPNCTPIIRLDQCIQVPLPTPVPTSTSTPSGLETATPTPTFAPIRGVFPPNGAIAPAGIVTLQWVSAGLLQDEETYLVEVMDTTSNTSWSATTTNTFMELPVTLIPNDGTTHNMQWRITVVKQVTDTQYNLIGGVGEWRNFQWQSR